LAGDIYRAASVQDTDGTVFVWIPRPPAVVIVVSICVQSTAGDGATYRTAAAADRYIIIIIIITDVIDDTPGTVTSYDDVISGLISIGICH